MPNGKVGSPIVPLWALEEFGDHWRPTWLSHAFRSSPALSSRALEKSTVHSTYLSTFSTTYIFPILSHTRVSGLDLALTYDVSSYIEIDGLRLTPGPKLLQSQSLLLLFLGGPSAISNRLGIARQIMLASANELSFDRFQFWPLALLEAGIGLVFLLAPFCHTVQELCLFKSFWQVKKSYQSTTTAKDWEC